MKDDDVDPILIATDIIVVITIDNINIGLCSHGDPYRPDINEELLGTLKLFPQRNCQLIVCATRTRGGTVGAVCAFCSQYVYDVKWIEMETDLPSQ